MVIWLQFEQLGLGFFLKKISDFAPFVFLAFVFRFAGSVGDFCLSFCCFVFTHEWVWSLFHSSISKPSVCAHGMRICDERGFFYRKEQRGKIEPKVAEKSFYFSLDWCLIIACLHWLWFFFIWFGFRNILDLLFHVKQNVFSLWFLLIGFLRRAIEMDLD